MFKCACLNTKDEFIESCEVNKQILKLIAKGTSSEVLIQSIIAGDQFGMSQKDIEEDIFEFFYIISGQVKLLQNEDTHKHTYFNEGDYFSFSNSDETYVFEAVTDIKLLYVSSIPVFQNTNNEYQHIIDLVDQVESKDIYTKEHSSRVCDISIKLAETLTLGHESIENTYYAAMFHDVGKLIVPSEILIKPGKLTDDEYDIIKRHVAESSKIIDSLEVLGISDIIMQHHERLDGSGYPNGLKGAEIKVEARIIAVADTYDAMTSTRAYRKALPSSAAIEELVKLSTTQYDPAIVQALIKLIDSGDVI